MFAIRAQGDMIHCFHVIPPGQYIVLSSDLGVEDVIEDDAATLKAAVSKGTCLPYDTLYAQHRSVCAVSSKRLAWLGAA